MGSGKEKWWVFAYVLSLETVFLPLFTQLPPFQSLDLSLSVILAMQSFSPIVQSKLLYSVYARLVSCTFPYFLCHIAKVAPNTLSLLSLPTRRLGHETILDHPATRRPTSSPERYERAQLSKLKSRTTQPTHSILSQPKDCGKHLGFAVICYIAKSDTTVAVLHVAILVAILHTCICLISLSLGRRLWTLLE